MKIAVLGCGPAGLLAAHGAIQSGAEVSILSVKQPSRIGGAQFIHKAIPGVTKDAPDTLIDFVKKGSEHGYAKKVYNDSLARTSWGEYSEGPHSAWNMRGVYGQLWGMYHSRIVDLKVTHVGIGQMLGDGYKVFSTIPRSALCVRPDLNHVFTKQDVWIQMPEAVHPPEDDKIIYSGRDEDPWYRYSQLFGVRSWEFAMPVPDAIGIAKPLRTNCSCWAGNRNLFTFGRYGRWDKWQLAHSAYEQARQTAEILVSGGATMSTFGEGGSPSWP